MDNNDQYLFPRALWCYHVTFLQWNDGHFACSLAPDWFSRSFCWRCRWDWVHDCFIVFVRLRIDPETMLRVISDVSVILSVTVLVCCFASQDIQRGSSLSPSFLSFSLSRSVSAHFPSLYSFDGVPCISHTGGLFIGSTCQEEVGNGGLLLQAGNSQQWPDEAEVCVYLCVCEGKEMSARWQMKKERWEVEGKRLQKSSSQFGHSFLCWRLWLNLNRLRKHKHTRLFKWGHSIGQGFSNWGPWTLMGLQVSARGSGKSLEKNNF